jgi:hypothetical protein
MKLVVGEGVPPYAAKILRDIQIRLVAGHGSVLESRHHTHIPTKHLLDQVWDAVHRLSEAVENEEGDPTEAAAGLTKCVVVLLDAKELAKTREVA